MSEPGAVTVAIVEDDAELRDLLRAIIDQGPGTRCVAACADAEQALAELPRLAPAVVLMDINLPGATGVECVARLAPLLPSALIIMLTAFDDTEVVVAALAAGAIGYLRKPLQPAELLAAIAEARAGGAPITSGIARRLIQTFRRPPADPRAAIETALTTREQEILRLMAKGHQHKEIAADLGISITTVRFHTASIYRKLQVQSRSQAVAKYLGS
jgi:DNA-binding NarL/FixJ family response regulator